MRTKTSLVVSLSLLLAMLSGCATNAMTGRSQLMLVSEKSAIAQSSQLYSTMIDGYGKKGKVSTDAAINARVQNITNRLVEQAILYRPDSQNWQWQVNVVEDDAINASCMPGGKMVVFTGLLNKIEPTDDELAQVMGHEIAHALANHGAEKMSMQMVSNAAIALVAVAASSRNNGQNQGIVNTAGAAGAAAFITLPNSRGAEEEADKLGIELAARAGYDPAAAVSLWKKMMEQSKQTSRFDFLSTHPSPPNRIDALQELQVPMAAIYQERKLAYVDYKPTRQFVKGSNADAILNSSNVRVVDPILEASNVRVISDPAFPDRPPAPEKPAPLDPGKALMFYSPQFEQFRQGKLELACTDCGFKFYRNQGDFKKYYEAGDWRMLAQSVIKVGYKLDLSYHYLAAAANGMGFTQAAGVYSAKAIELAATENFACAKGAMIKCEGIQIGSIAP